VAATATYGVIELFSFLLLLPLTSLLLVTRQLGSLSLFSILFLDALVPLMLPFLLVWLTRRSTMRLSRVSLVRELVETARSYRISTLGCALVLALAVGLLNLALLSCTVEHESSAGR